MAELGVDFSDVSFEMPDFSEFMTGIETIKALNETMDEGSVFRCGDFVFLGCSFFFFFSSFFPIAGPTWRPIWLFSTLPSKTRPSRQPSFLRTRPPIPRRACLLLSRIPSRFRLPLPLPPELLPPRKRLRKKLRKKLRKRFRRRNFGALRAGPARVRLTASRVAPGLCALSAARESTVRRV